MNSVIENQIENQIVNPDQPFRYNVIPKIPDFFRELWNIPDMSMVLINDKYAIMSEREFHQLPWRDYKDSKRVGKCWKEVVNNVYYLYWIIYGDEEPDIDLIYLKSVRRQILISNR